MYFDLIIIVIIVIVYHILFLTNFQRDGIVQKHSQQNQEDKKMDKKYKNSKQ